MAQDSNNRYAAPHVWNLAAKQIREVALKYEDYEGEIASGETHPYDVVQEVACQFADRFDEDEGFNRKDFLKRCDPLDWGVRR